MEKILSIELVTRVPLYAQFCELSAIHQRLFVAI